MLARAMTKIFFFKTCADDDRSHCATTVVAEGNTATADVQTLHKRIPYLESVLAGSDRAISYSESGSAGSDRARS